MHLRSARSAKPSILVIEGDPVTRAHLKRLFFAEGFDLADAASADQNIDLVIAGLTPGCAVQSMAAAISRLEPAAPVLALIGSAAWNGFDFFDAANAIGAAAVLQRPVPRTALLRAIAALLQDAAGGWDDLPIEGFLRIDDLYFA